jgi:hypothetical protein
VAAQAQATIAYNFGTSLVGNQSGTFSLGTEFTVGTTPIDVTALGAFDPGDAKFTGTGIQVAIYKLTLSGTTITGSTLETPSVSFLGQYTDVAGTSTAMQNITPVKLTAGTYMVVANHYGSGGVLNDYNPYYGPGGGVNNASANNASGVTFIAGGGYYNTSSGLSWGSSLGSGWVYDNAFNKSAPRYAAGNFEFTPVPEVAAFGAAGVGLLGLVYIGRYARLRRTMKLA